MADLLEEVFENITVEGVEDKEEKDNLLMDILTNPNIEIVFDLSGKCGEDPPEE
jgi:hypothetical protein